MLSRYASVSLFALWAARATAAPAVAAESQSNVGGVGVLDVSVPVNRKDDQYYTVPIKMDGQVLPLLLDTGSADIFVASNECPANDSTDGCYNLQERFQIASSTRIIPNETFFTIVGEGSVYGNNSNLTVGLGGIQDGNLATGLIYSSTGNEFQNGSFSGILGLSMRAVSRQLHFNNREPPFDDMLKKGIITEPRFSMTLPRLGDENSFGKLTIGGIGEEFEGSNITYGPVYNTPNYNTYPNNTLDRQGWTAHLEGIRVNNNLVAMNNGSLIPTGEYLGLFDSGSKALLLRYPELYQVVSFLNGPIVFQPPNDVFFACDTPQLIELKYFDIWYPIDPLDLLIPYDTRVINGTLMCHSGLGTWSRTFGDGIMGVPFLRSVGAVFDYIDSDLVPQPRLGLMSRVNAQEAMAAYAGKLEKRLSPYG